MTDRRGSGNYPGNATMPDGIAPIPQSTLDFEGIYTEQFAFVWRSLRALGVRPELLDDATQDVFLVVYRRVAGFEGRSSLRTWLFSIVEHVAFNYRRAQRRKAAPLQPIDPAHASDAPDPLEHATGSEAARFVERFLESLDDGKRAVFALALIEELPAPEVAQVLGIPVNTVYSRVRTVRQAFRDAAAAYQESKP